MNDVLSSAQMITFFWDSFKGLGSVLVFILAYILKEWRATQKEYVKKVDQMVIDMRSLKDATHATNETLERMIVSNGEGLQTMKEDQRESNRLLVKSFEMLVENEILKSRNTS